MLVSNYVLELIRPHATLKNLIDSLDADNVRGFEECLKAGVVPSPWTISECCSRDNKEYAKAIARHLKREDVNFPVVDWVAGYGHFEETKALLQRGFEVTTSAITWASEDGYTEIVSFLLEKGCPVSEEAINNAFVREHFECLKVLCEYGAPIDSKRYFPQTHEELLKHAEAKFANKP